MIAFVIATPLQFFNALSVLETGYKDEKADFFVFRFAVKDIDQILKRTSGFRCIGNIYILDDYYKSNSRLGFVKDVFCGEKKCFRKIKYSDLFITYTGNRNQIICNEVYRNNPDVKIHFFEEGIGIYIKNPMIPVQDNIMYNSLYRITGYKKIMENVSCIHVYKPDLIDKQHININRIPEIIPINPICESNSPMIYNELCSIFDFKKYNIEKKCIYFDQWFYNSTKEKDYKLYKDFFQSQFLRKIETKTGIKITVKKHPVTKSLEYEKLNFEMFDYSGVWEFFLMNNDVNNTVFMTLFSTAIFSPKIIFDQEPVILMIGKSVANELIKCGKKHLIAKMWNSGIEEFALKVRAKYQDKEKFYIPNSFEELYEIIYKLKRKKLL